MFQSPGSEYADVKEEFGVLENELPLFQVCAVAGMGTPRFKDLLAATKLSN